MQVSVKNRQELCRKDLKHNFLKRIIIRFDYLGVSEIELDAIIKDIKITVGESYTKLTTELATELDFQIDDPEIVELEGIPIGDVRKQKVYVFRNDISGIQLKISPVFALITINKTKYMDFFEYSKTLIRVMQLLRDRIPFFDGIRFGLRKINQCFIENIEVINDYFEPRFYNLFTMGENSHAKIYSAKDCISYNEYNINLSRTVLNGELNQKPAYQIVLDSDIYLLDNEKIQELINDSSLLEPMNDILFNIYKSVITESLIQKLQEDVFEDRNIMGVNEFVTSIKNNYSTAMPKSKGNKFTSPYSVKSPAAVFGKVERSEVKHFASRLVVRK